MKSIYITATPFQFMRWGKESFYKSVEEHYRRIDININIQEVSIRAVSIESPLNTKSQLRSTHAMLSLTSEFLPVYRISRTGFGSARYGNCQLCHKHADSMYICTRYEPFELDELDVDPTNRFPVFPAPPFANAALAHKGSVFAHLECIYKEIGYV